MNKKNSKIWVMLFCSLLLTFHYSSTAALESDPEANSTYTSALDHPNFLKRISVDLKDINIADAIRYLADKAEVNVAISKNVGGRATLSFNSVTIRDALEITLLTNDLAAEKRGEIIFILLAEEYETRYGEVWSDAREVRMFQLQYARASDVLEALSTVKSTIGNIVVNDESGLIVLMETPDNIAEMKEIIGIMDKETLTQVFELKHADAKAIEESLSARLNDKGIGTIKADERTNQVIITSLPGKMDEIEKIIEEVDVRERQVLIEAKIVKVSLSPDFDMGIDWQYIARRGQKDTIDVDVDFDIPSTITNLGTLTYGTLATDDYSGVLKLLKTIGETKLLSSPRITAVNNQEAKILVGTKEAYITQTITQGDTTTTTAENVTFLDVGVQLMVTPTISADGYVKIIIKPEVSSVTRTITTAEGNEIPIVDTTVAETTVIVKDGHTIIIGGLIKDETLRTTRKIPGLGDIPLLGKMLFSSLDEDKEKTELVVFLTPKIIFPDVNMESWEQKVPRGLRGFE